MSYDILYVFSSFVLGVLLLFVAFFIRDDIIVAGLFLFLSLIVFLEGFSSFLYILSYKSQYYSEDKQNSSSA